MVTVKQLAVRGASASALAFLLVAPAFAAPSLAPTDSSLNPAFSLTTFFQNGVQTAINLVFFLAGVAAIIYLIWAGIKYITSGGDVKKAGEARQAIINAVIGIAVVIGAYTLINIAFGINQTVTSVSGSAVTFS